ncbi:MAG TPA: GntR family transcriptional regulator [Verrucomicrobiota bacterium]|nr:GntR family transcriptional regulator [Verrucomicrobiota bacterium]HNU49950.1 GntR family transcriptional regulator [Verrucomicrobiota bacterium]
MTSTSFTPPKYFQISREIIERIQRGELSIGAPVPSETEIIERYRVSNTTARKVLHELEKAGWVTRIKGRGTFVRQYAVERAITRIFGFTRNMIEVGRKPSTRLIGLRVRDEPHSQIVNGREFTMAGPVCEIERLRLADGIPMMKETRTISLQLCPDIQQRNLEQSLYSLFETEYRIHLTEIDQMLSAIMLEGPWLDIFKTPRPIPAFRVEGVSFAGKGLIVEMEDSVYRGDMYQFAAKASRHDHG